MSASTIETTASVTPSVAPVKPKKEHNEAGEVVLAPGTKAGDTKRYRCKYD